MISQKMTKKIAKIVVFIILPLFFFISCNKNIIISEKKGIMDGVWKINKTVVLSPKINNTEKNYNIFIDVEIKENFLTNNIWLFIQTKSPTGSINNDTIQYFVTDATGKWFGNKKGNFIENKFLYKSNIRFSEPGIYTFHISHGMRVKDLPKVKSIGIVIEETNAN